MFVKRILDKITELAADAASLAAVLGDRCQQQVAMLQSKVTLYICAVRIGYKPSNNVVGQRLKVTVRHRCQYEALHTHMSNFQFKTNPEVRRLAHMVKSDAAFVSHKDTRHNPKVAHRIQLSNRLFATV